MKDKTPKLKVCINTKNEPHKPTYTELLIENYILKIEYVILKIMVTIKEFIMGRRH